MDKKIALFTVSALAAVYSNLLSAQNNETYISSLVFEDENLAKCVFEVATTFNRFTVEEFTFLPCSDREVSSAAGIEQLTSLRYLGLNGNQLAEIDVSANSLLERLYLNDNLLTAGVNLDNNPLLNSLNLADNSIAEVKLGDKPLLTVLGLAGNSISDIDLGSYSNLEYLSLANNQLTELDLSNNTQLTELYISNNQLTELNLSNNTQLTELHIGNNQLSSIDLSFHTALKTLYVEDNLLNSIDVSHNPALLDLNAQGNLLTEIDVSANADLTYFTASDNKISEIDLSHNPALLRLMLSNNQIGEIDLSANTRLRLVYLNRNQLSDIDFSLNTKLTDTNIRENPLNDDAMSYLSSMAGFSNEFGYLQVGYGAFHSAYPSHTIHIPVVSIDGIYYRVELTLVDAEELQFEITEATEIQAPSIADSATFSGGVLTIPDLLYGTVHFSVTLNIVDSDSSIVFALNEATWID